MKRTTIVLSVALGAALFAVPAVANARGPYVTIRDDGRLAAKLPGNRELLDAVTDAYLATGEPMPQVMSVWTSFTMDASALSTRFVPASNDVSGIGVEHEYHGDGKFESRFPPLRAVMLHNDVTKLEETAARTKTPLEGYAEYLFLLELSHLWGPAVRVPASTGAPADVLLDVPFHWSFWLDAGGSPAGGNRWRDNGDGTFTTLAQSPSTVAFSKLDLYLMGLAGPEEVEPFGVLENVEVPKGAADPVTGGAISRATFPWFQAAPLTVKATRRTFSIDDVIAANGPRSPGKAQSPTALDMGIVLFVRKNADDAEVARAEESMDAVAPKLAPAFERATGGRGQLRVVTKGPAAPATEPTLPGPPPSSAASTADASSQKSGCSVAGSGASMDLAWLTPLGLLLARRALKKRRRAETSPLDGGAEASEERSER